MNSSTRPKKASPTGKGAMSAAREAVVEMTLLEKARGLEQAKDRMYRNKVQATAIDLALMEWAIDVACSAHNEMVIAENRAARRAAN